MKNMLNSIIRPQKVAEERELHDRITSIQQSQLEKDQNKMANKYNQAHHMTYAQQQDL